MRFAEILKEFDRAALDYVIDQGAPWYNVPVEALLEFVEDGLLYDIAVRCAYEHVARHLPKKITQAAIRIGNLVCVGHRHNDIIWAWGGLTRSPLPDNAEQGFLGDDGKFYDRVAAAKIVTITKQCALNHPPLLYSEDLY